MVKAPQELNQSRGSTMEMQQEINDTPCTADVSILDMPYKCNIRRSEIAIDAIPTLSKRHGLPWCLHYNLTASPRGFCCTDGDCTSLPQNPCGALMSMPSQRICFGYVQNESRPSVVNGVSWRLYVVQVLCPVLELLCHK